MSGAIGVVSVPLAQPAIPSSRVSPFKNCGRVGKESILMSMELDD